MHVNGKQNSFSYFELFICLWFSPDVRTSRLITVGWFYTLPNTSNFRILWKICRYRFHSDNSINFSLSILLAKWLMFCVKCNLNPKKVKSQQFAKNPLKSTLQRQQHQQQLERISWNTWVTAKLWTFDKCLTVACALPANVSALNSIVKWLIYLCMQLSIYNTLELGRRPAGRWPHCSFRANWKTRHELDSRNWLY